MMKTINLAILVLGICSVGCAAELPSGSRTAEGNLSQLEVEKKELAKLKSEEFRKWKTEAADTSRDRDKRAYAVLRIAQLGSDESAHFLAEMWETPLSVLDHEKLSIIDWAGEFGSDACVPMLRTALAHPFRDVRWHAARSLLQIQGANALPQTTELAEKDPDGIVRSQTKEFISHAVSRAENQSDHCAIARRVILWGKSPDSGPYIKEETVYLLKESHPSRLGSGSLRLYSRTELKLLDKTFQAYAIHGIRITGEVATAVLKMAMDPPVDPVPFPYSGWTLKFEKKNGTWAVVKAVKNEPSVELKTPANQAMDSDKK
jgi:hypothetical protein